MEQSEPIVFQRLSLYTPLFSSMKTVGICMLDGFPDLLRIGFDRMDDGSGKIFVGRYMTDQRVYTTRWPYPTLHNLQCEGKIIWLWNMTDTQGLVISYVNGSFTSELVSIPYGTTGIVMGDDSTYSVCSDLKSYMIVPLGSSAPLWTTAIESASESVEQASSIGQYLLMFCLRGSSFSLKMYAVKARSIEFEREVNLSFSLGDKRNSTAVDGRYFIVISESEVSIIDCLLMGVVTFSHTIVSPLLGCTACVRGKYLQLYVLTSSTDYTRYIYEAALPLGHFSPLPTATSRENMTGSIESDFDRREEANGMLPLGIFMIDGYPELLRLYFEYTKGDSGTLVVCRETSAQRVYQFPWTEFAGTDWQCNGANMSCWNTITAVGMVITCANGSFTSQRVSLPDYCHLVIVFGYNTIYFVCQRESFFVLISNDTSPPLMRQFFTMLYRKDDKIILNICNMLEELGGDDLKTFRDVDLPISSVVTTVLVDQYFIAVDAQKVVIANCMNTQISIFSHSINSQPMNCTARIREKYFDVFVLTTDLNIYKASLSLIRLSYLRTSGEKENLDFSICSTFNRVLAQRRNSLSTEQEPSDSLFLTPEPYGEFCTEQEPAQDLSSLETTNFSIRSYEQEVATYSIGSRLNSETEKNESDFAEQEVADSFAVPEVYGESCKEQEPAHFSDDEEERRVPKLEQGMLAELSAVETELSRITM